MANEKWYRIEWDEELWTKLDSVPSDRIKTNIGRRNAEDMVVEDMHMHENVNIPSELSEKQDFAVDLRGSLSRMQEVRGDDRKNTTANFLSSFDDPGDVRYASDSAFEGVGKVEPRLDSGFVQEAPSYIASFRGGGGFDFRRETFNNETLSDVQRPVNFTHIRNTDTNSNRMLKDRSYESVPDGYLSENVSVVGEENDFLQKESNRTALQQTVRQVVEEKLSELKVYVLESDITDAQQAVKTVVKQATF